MQSISPQPLPRSEELCLSEALTVFIFCSLSSTYVGVITVVEELTWHHFNDGVVCSGQSCMERAGEGYMKLIPRGPV